MGEAGEEPKHRPARLALTHRSPTSTIPMQLAPTQSASSHSDRRPQPPTTLNMARAKLRNVQSRGNRSPQPHTTPNLAPSWTRLRDIQVVVGEGEAGEEPNHPHQPHIHHSTSACPYPLPRHVCPSFFLLRSKLPAPHDFKYGATLGKAAPYLRS